MSRIAALAALGLAATAQADVIETYRAVTSVEPRCRVSSGNEITVCGRREADKYRVPFVSAPVPGDPKTTNVPEERARLVARESACQQRAALPYGCGMAGVRMTTKIGSGKIEYRPLAP